MQTKWRVGTHLHTCVIGVVVGGFYFSSSTNNKDIITHLFRVYLFIICRLQTRHYHDHPYDSNVTRTCHNETALRLFDISYIRNVH